MKLKNFIKKLFVPNEATLKKREKRKEHKANRKIIYDMPPFYSSDYNENFDIDIYTVAFNDAKLIKYQIKFLKKFVKSKFLYTVIDNSYNKEESEKIRAICQRENVAYFKVFKPKKIRGTYSASHAMALNWAYENVIKARKSNFALIDHDMFLVSEEDVAAYVKNDGLFGVLISSYSGKDPDFYYLWGGFSFFNWDIVVKGKKLDFGRLPNFWGKHLSDTGASNWHTIYKHYDRNLITPINNEIYNLYTKSFNIEGCKDIRRNCVEYLYNRKWLHLLSASGWCEIGDKNDYAYKLLDSILERKGI